MTRVRFTLAILFLAVGLNGASQTGTKFGQSFSAIQANSSPPVLDIPISHFELTNGTLFDGLSRLSSEPIPLQLGFEEVLKQHDNDIGNPEPRFSIKLDHATVRAILDSLCSRDSRYVWSTDELIINVYPRAVKDDPSYLLNRKISSIEFDSLIDPYQALTPIARHFPTEQVGYRHLGGDVRYPIPLSVKFDNLTVRQIINRVTAHLGPQGGWTFFGSKQNRWFTFHNGYFGPVANN